MSLFDTLLSGVFSLIEDSAGRLSNDRSLSSSKRSEFASMASQAKDRQREIRESEAQQCRKQDND